MIEYQPWVSGWWVGFDLETTGPDPTTARIVTASLIAVHPVTGERVEHEWLVDPGVPIDPGATAVHGISTEYATEHGLAPDEAVEDIVTTLNEYCHDAALPLVAFNGAYDLSVLHREAVRHNAERPSSTIRMIDPFVIDKELDKYRKGSRKLTSMAQYYGVPLTEDDAHDSAADTLATCRVLFKQLRRWPRLAQQSLDELHDLQKEWYWEQKDSLEDYLRQTKNDQSIVLSRTWPIIPIDSVSEGIYQGSAGTIRSLIRPEVLANLRQLSSTPATTICQHGPGCRNPTRAANRLCWRHGGA